MRALANRVIWLAAKANDAADNVLRFVFSRVDKPLNWETSKCSRTRIFPRINAWEMQRLRERIEAGRKRVVALYGQQSLASPAPSPHCCVVERLQAGRLRARQRYFIGETGCEMGGGR